MITYVACRIMCWRDGGVCGIEAVTELYMLHSSDKACAKEVKFKI